MAEVKKRRLPVGILSIELDDLGKGLLDWEEVVE